MTSLACPVCRVHLPAGGTHCPRCGLRVAALPRRGPVAAADGDADPAAAGGAVDWHWVGARGGAAGAAIVLAAVVVGLAVGVPRRQFLTVVDNAATAAGMAAVVLAVILGGVRISRWAGGVHRLRGDPGGCARVEIRLAAGLAGIIPLALAVALTVVTIR
ncbi:MAG: hypothetical protein E6J14_00850 [Chloroflexi bacterium]|nr:MAG: hypothetical protein E6J14_00850 [Chloroflexota bacterium]